jgi:hypothetical protein
MATFTSALLKPTLSAVTGWGGQAAILVPVAAILVAANLGCGGNNSGNGDLNAILRPWVVSVAPVNTASGVSFTNPVITATFSEQMAPINGNASFTLSSALNPNVSGTVVLDSTKRIATFTPTNILVPATLYTATVNGITSNTTGRSIENAYTWTFTTGIALPLAEAAMAPWPVSAVAALKQGHE